MNQQTKITIYIDSITTFSQELQQDLERAGIQHEIRMVDQDIEAASEMLKITDKPYVPVIEIIKDGEQVILTGYSLENKTKIEKLLNIKL